MRPVKPHKLGCQRIGRPLEMRMLKLSQSRFFRGPNLRAPQSGLLAQLLDEGPRPVMGWRADAGEAARVIAALRTSMPVAVESAFFDSPQGLVEAKFPVLALLMATAEIILRDFVVRPQPGRVLGVRPAGAGVFIPCDEANSGLVALTFCSSLSAALHRLDDPGTRERIHAAYLRARQAIRAGALNQSTIGIVRAAASRGIPHYRLAERGQFVQLGQGCHAQRIMETATDTTSIVGRTTARDKLSTSRMLQALGMPTAGTTPVADADEAVKAATALGYPVVVKPRSSGKGRGVSTNLADEGGVRRAAGIALAVGAGLIVERHVTGEDHRLLVIGGRFVAAAGRTAASVTGDGRQSVRALIAQANLDPRRGDGFERVMQRIEFDDEARHCIAQAGLTPDSVMEAGRVLRLRGAANLSRGGTSTDLTGTIHPDNIRLAERAAAAVGLEVAGIDFQTPDITRSWRDVPCAILEVNAIPGLRPHLAANPDCGVFEAMVDHLFPPGRPSRVPTVGVTGSAGKTSTCRLIAAMLARSGLTVGLASTQGVFVGTDLRKPGDHAGGSSGSVLLTDPGVEAAVIEFARGGLLKRGFRLDAVDVGVVLNVHDNHIGLDGVNSREDLARVKRLVAEAARHCVVLHADHALCLAMREHAGAPVALVSRRHDNAELTAHRRGGGMGACVDASGRALELFDRGVVVGRIDIAAIPTSWDGRYAPAIDHALAAMTAAHALGLAFDTIDHVLRHFQHTGASNPGRMNYYTGLPYDLLVSHADGPVQMSALADFVRQLDVPGRKTLLLCAAGDRSDDFIRGIAHAVAGAFDHYVCSDWSVLRGREPGEVARLLADALGERGVDVRRMQVAQDLQEAVQFAFASARAGDLVVDNSYTDTHSAQWLRARAVPMGAAC